MKNDQINMKSTTLVLVLGFLTGIIELSAQTDYISQYHAWITSVNSTFGEQGFLYQLKDSSVLLSNVSNFNNRKMQLQEFQIAEIGLIKVRKRDKMLKGAALGALAGLGFGIVTGLMEGDDPQSHWIRFDAEDKALILGALFMPAGAVIGAMIGNITTKIPINGSFDTYQKQKQKLLRYSWQ